ncbi:MAG: translation initiation factor IF-2 [Bdellovibrionota bacterium]
MSEQQQESLKVFELAKELGLDSFTLLDKLKQINIEVKSHMSSLAADQAQAIRDALNKSNKPAAKAGAVKKRSSAAAPAGAVAAKKPAAKKAAAAEEAPKPATKASVTKKAAPVASSDEPKRKVIKRRVGAEGGEADAHGSHEAEAFVAPVQEVVEPAEPVEAAAPQAEEIVQAAPEAAEPAPAAPVEAAPTPVAPAAVVPPPAQPVMPSRPVADYTPRANAPGTKVIFRTPNQHQRVVEKDELSGEGTPRRLKIVSAAPPVVPGSRPSAPTYRTPGGPVAGSNRPRPPGSAPAAPGPDTDMFRPMTSYVAKEEEGKKRGGNTTRGPTPEEIRISDFRKRELVFQPKRKKLPPGKQVKQTEITEMAAHKKKIRMEDKIVVSELAQRMGEKGNDVMKKLVQLGVMVGLNQTVDFDTATLIAQEFGWEVENVAFNEAEILQTAEATEKFVLRPPIITVMGHVDHGKTSLLDAIRKADVAAGEAGGITQHIGAYSVMINGKPITFLDTPGHEAFANMRSRGANVTDIVVLVVAADDSIMPQTKEAIQHAINAKVPIIVAANKMDKPDANVDRLKKDLSANNVLVEEWGGEVPLVPISALKKTGIEDLLATIQIQAEVLDLKADPDRAAEGIILEARMEKGRGIMADLLVKKGTLRNGDFMVVGTAYGRIRAMTNDRGQNITEVGPGFPAEIYGLNDIPSAGDSFNVVKDETAAKEISQDRLKKALEKRTAATVAKPLTMEELMAKMPVKGMKEHNVLVKADVVGSAEAIRESIEKIKSDKVKAKVIQCGVGVINENDVHMAKTANALIIGFNSKPDGKARDVAKREKVEVHHYSIIYQLLDQVRESMEGLLEPIRRETQIGKAEVKQVFTVSKLGTVAGSVVLDGKVVRNSFARVMRGKDIVAEGKVVSLRRFKDDASETIKGQECGIGVENFEKFLPNDVINVYNVELVKQTL